MKSRKNKKYHIIYPENTKKQSWDIFITLVLIFSCALIPLKLALEEDFSSDWATILYIIDFAFIIDMLLCFFTAYDDEDFQVHDNQKDIA